MILDIQDIINCASVPALLKDDFIKRGSFRKLPNGDLQACVGGFSIVFPVEVGGQVWAFRCWHHTLEEAQKRIKCLSDNLKLTSLPYFVNFTYSEQGITVNGRTYPTTRMRWIDGQNIKEYICHNKNDKGKLFKLAADFYKMTQDLHRHSIAHGDLQHENIIINRDGKIYLIDYDSMYIPENVFENAKNTTNGKVGYQHPSRANCVYANEKLDYFSEVVILISILAVANNPSLIERYKFADSDLMIFKTSDFDNLTSSEIFSELSKQDEVVVVLLKVLQYYLRKSDITEIPPLENAVNQASPTNAISLTDYFNNAERKLAEQEAEARKKNDTENWQFACRNDNSTSYSNYLHKWPLGIYADEAKKRLAAKKKLEEDAAKRVADERDWNTAKLHHTSTSYSDYIAQHPSGIYRNEAKKLVEELTENEFWLSAKSKGTKTAVTDYIKHYPSGRFVADAKSLLNKIEKKLAEENEWSKTKNDNTIKGFKRFICLYPSSVHVQEARDHLKKLKSDRRTRILVLVAKGIIAVVVLTFAAGRWYIECSKGIDSQPPATSKRVIDLDSLEKATRRQINGLKVAKSKGWSLNEGIYDSAGQNLNELKTLNSSEYQKLKQEYDKLK